jgi:two-component system response regulator YesN
MHSVLLVDDEVFARKGLRRLIDWASCGYRVIGEADNGEDAYAIIRRLKPDLVITDVRMPVMDGLELIRKTTENEPEQPGFIIISGYNEFAYAQQAVRYGVHDFILKPVDENELKAALRQLDEKLRREKLIRGKKRQLFHNLLVEAAMKGEADEASLQAWAEQLGIRPGEAVRYAFLEINDRHPWAETGPELADEEEYGERIRRVIGQMAGEGMETLLHKHHNRFGVLLTRHHLDLFGGDCDRLARELQRKLSDSLKTPVYVYVGAPVDDLRRLGNSYRSARDALLYKFVVEPHRTVVHEQVRNLHLQFIDLDDELYRRLMNRIGENRPHAIAETIDEMFHEFATKRYVPEAVKAAIHRCVSGTVRLLNEEGLDERELASFEPIVAWPDYNVTPGELKRLFLRFMVESAELLGNRRKESLRGTIRHIRAYIDEHFRENISLKGIAARFYINPVYLGQLFKKTYGVYFNEYVLRLRVEEAKRLLRQTDLRIYEIAELVGFSNADYFVTQFEKLERMTPTEYRKQWL